MNKTSIPWADFSWNPTTGCTFGCEWCYARAIARRFSVIIPEDGEPRRGGLDPESWGVIERQYDKAVYAGEAETFPLGFTPTMYENRLDEPLRRKKPSVIFLGSMGDVFDPAIPDDFRDRIFMTTLLADRHTFVVLTKRAKAMCDYFTDPDRASAVFLVQPNLILGVSVTNQADADERIPLLLDTPAAKRMVSVEPMLGPVELFGLSSATWGTLGVDNDGFMTTTWTTPTLDFVAVGGKTPGKPLHEDYGCFNRYLPHNDCVTRYCNKCEAYGTTPRDALRSLRDQCLAAGVPFHYKHGNTNPALDGAIYDAAVPR